VGGNGRQYSSLESGLLGWPDGALVGDDDRWEECAGTWSSCVCVCAESAGDSYYYYSTRSGDVGAVSPWTAVSPAVSVLLLHLATPSQPARPPLLLLHRYPIRRLSEQGETAAETSQTLRARWIPPRLTAPKGHPFLSLQHWKKGRREEPLLALRSSRSPHRTHARLGTT
jgi:hypothetical protein